MLRLVNCQTGSERDGASGVLVSGASCELRTANCGLRSDSVTVQMEASDNDIDNEEVVWGRELEGDVEELYSALLSLRKHLTVAPPQQARAALNTLQLAQLFNCLDTADKLVAFICF